MLAALALAYVIIGPNGAIEAKGRAAAVAPAALPRATAPAAAKGTTGAVPPAAHKLPVPPLDCPASASLPPDPGVAYEPMKGPLPADLPGPKLALGDKVTVPLDLYLPRPAPFGSQIHLGQAQIDLKTGGVTINGQDFSSAPVDCR